MHLLRGTLDGLVLKALSTRSMHGYEVADFVHRATNGVLEIEDGALYRSLHRMEERGWLDAEWGSSEQGRRAKYYRLTAAGRKRLRAEEREWRRYADAVGRVFAAGGGGE